MSLGVSHSVLADDSAPVEAPKPTSQAPEKRVSFFPQIDKLIAAGTADYEKLASPLADDSEFLRRITLDLTGMIPTTAQTRKFLADSNPEKRAQIIDQLLNSPEYARHMQRRFDVLMMRRLASKTVPPADWQAYLRQSFAENKPWNQLVQEIMEADGSDPKTRARARFYLDRAGDVNLITQDIGRVFLGADLECAQCHDHPEIDDFKMNDYYGISSFLIRSFVYTDKKKKTKPVIAEKAEGETKFEDIFEIRDKVSKGPRTIGMTIFGGEPLEEPTFKKGEEYVVAPKKDNSVRPVPKFSRRALLGKALTSPKNRRFARTSANRLWALMMGRGLIHPLQDDHSENPPSHPELLDLLTDQLVAMNFDIKAYLREIALSQTYQRTSRRTEQNTAADDSTFTHALLKPLHPAQFAWAVVQATGEADTQRISLKDKLTEDALNKRLAGYENKFVALFGGQPGSPPEEFLATIDQALFLSNDSMVMSLTTKKKGNLVDRLLLLPADNPAAIADELFVSVLTRKPTADEVQDVSGFLKDLKPAEKTAAFQELVWALVTSLEFRFNH